MNNTGFTLIELVAIILVLATVFLVSFPNFLNLSKNDEEKKYKEFKDSLCMAGESYIYANETLLEDISLVGNTIEISVEELMIYGSVKQSLNNPITNRSAKKDMLNYTVLSDNTLKCKYIEK